MANYVNPTGTFNTTDQADSVVFNTVLAPGFTVIDTLGGIDSLTVQFETANPVRFEATDLSSLGAFHVYGVFSDAQLLMDHVESIDLHGGSNSDNFTLLVGSNIAPLNVSMDGGAGWDSIEIDWSRQSSALSFVVNGSTIASNWGSFSNFENFEIIGGSGNDTITTGAGNDHIETGTGSDNVNAGAGVDEVYSYSSSGTLDGGDGVDSLSANFSTITAPLAITVGDTVQSSSGLTAVNFERVGVAGGAGDDQITVNRTSGAYYGGPGHDLLIVNAPFTSGVQVAISAYDTQLDGNISGNVTFYGFEAVSIAGTQFDDQFQISAVYSATGTEFSFDGGAGADKLTADFSHFTGASSIVVAADGSIASNRGNLSSIETFDLTGGALADTFVTGSGNDWLTGGAGSDHLDGGAGNDMITGGATADDDGAADVLIAGAGDDRVSAGFGDSVDGGSGFDILYYNALAGTHGITADFSQLTSGHAIDIAGATLTGIETLTGIGGTNFNDTIVAGASSNNIRIDGFGGDDHLTGASGITETIAGGDGNDVLTGGIGADYLWGGAGADTFIDTAAGFNGDILDELGIDDKIIITDANPNGFSFSVSGNVLSYTGGSFVISGNLAGHVVASAATGGGVQLELQLPPVGTVDQIANQLVNGFWNANGMSARHFNVAQGGTISVNITGLTADGQTLARAALGEWSDILGVQFSEVGTGGQIVFDDNQSGAFSDSVTSGGFITSSIVNVSTAWLSAYGTGLNSYSFQSYIHEIGHALGLGHAGNYNEFGTYGQDAIFLNDAWSTSIMSYFNPGENIYFAERGFSILNAVTPMESDIVAMQTLYGLSTTTRTGDTIYGMHSNAGAIYDAQTYFNVAYTIFDSGGNDTVDYSGTSARQLINLNPETFSNVNGYTGNMTIARGVVIENAVGGEGADTIIGNAADNVLRGNLGGDLLTGGAGSDTFRDTAAGLNGDTISDFSTSDRIVIIDANPGAFTFSLSGSVLSYTGGSLVLLAPIAGTFVSSPVAGGGVQLTLSALPPHDPNNDFDGDGRSDILWRNDNGALTDWLGTGSGGFAPNGANLLTVVDTGWQVAGSGDFNGDGKDDVLWRRADGALTDWLGNAGGGLTPNGANLLTVVDTQWQVAGVGDFNGDGKDDVLWHRGDGAITDWLGNASAGLDPNAANFLDVVNTQWQVAGVGDFNGDGKDDILWRSTDGRITDWLGTATGAFSDNAVNALNAVSLDWQIAGIGDFNGDGRDDILWRNVDGRITDWLGTPNGGFAPNSANFYTSVGTNWQVAGVGDYNGDGRDDILWRASDGRISNWLGTLTGGFADNLPSAYNDVDPHWHAQPGTGLF